MQRSVSRRWSSWSVVIGATALAGAGLAFSVATTGCGPNAIVTHHVECPDPDAGAEDGGDAGTGGAGGSQDPDCD
jgi:hypothetical protein